MRMSKTISHADGIDLTSGLDKPQQPCQVLPSRFPEKIKTQRYRSIIPCLHLLTCAWDPPSCTTCRMSISQLWWADNMSKLAKMQDFARNTSCSTGREGVRTGRGGVGGRDGKGVEIWTSVCTWDLIQGAVDVHDAIPKGAPADNLVEDASKDDDGDAGSKHAQQFEERVAEDDTLHPEDTRPQQPSWDAQGCSGLTAPWSSQLEVKGSPMDVQIFLHRCGTLNHSNAHPCLPVRACLQSHKGYADHSMWWVEWRGAAPRGLPQNHPMFDCEDRVSICSGSQPAQHISVLTACRTRGPMIR